MFWSGQCSKGDDERGMKEEKWAIMGVAKAYIYRPKNVNFESGYIASLSVKGQESTPTIQIT